MTKKIEVDWDLCESNGVCMGIIPEVFQLGDDDMLTVLQPEVTPENDSAGARRSPAMPAAGHFDHRIAVVNAAWRP